MSEHDKTYRLLSENILERFPRIGDVEPVSPVRSQEKRPPSSREGGRFLYGKRRGRAGRSVVRVGDSFLLSEIIVCEINRKMAAAARIYEKKVYRSGVKKVLLCSQWL